MAEAMSVKAIFDAMPLGINQDAAKDANKNGGCTVEEGTATAPDVTICAAATDYMNIVSGAYPFGLAFVNGRLKVEGDLRLLIRMGKYLAPSS